MVTGILWTGGYLLTAIAMSVFAFVYWQNRRVRGMQYLFFGAIVASVSSLLYLLLVLAPLIEVKVTLWKAFQLLGLLALFSWYTFVVTWTGRDRLATNRGLSLVGAPFLLLGLLVATNASPQWSGMHTLYWSEATIGPAAGAIAPLSLSSGPGATAHALVTSLVALWSIGLLVEFTLRDEQQLYLVRNGLLVLAGVAGLVLAVGGSLVGLRFDPLPLSFLLANTLAAVGVFQFGMYNVVSIPEDAIIEAIDGAVLLYGDNGAVMDMNRAAAEVLDLSDDVLGKGIVGVVETVDGFPSVRGNGDGMADRPDSPRAISESLDGHEFTTTVGNESRTFIVRVSDLTDETGQRLGWSILCYDVTELRHKQEELDLLKQVLSRVLRHNVRNDLSVVRSNAEILEEEASGLQAERLDTIVEKTQDLLDASEKARAVERVLEGDRGRQTIDVAEKVSKAVSSIREDYPDAIVETDVPDSLRAEAHWSLSIAIENLIENGIVHNERERPRVRVGARAADDCVRLGIADNGPGIPLSELQVLRRREETQLEHGSGIGLWVVSWIVELCHGDIEFENTGDGCRVTVELPPAEESPITDIPTDIVGDLDIGESTAAVDD